MFDVAYSDIESKSINKRGRPEKEFSDCKDRTKRSKAVDLAGQYSLEHLEMASISSGKTAKGYTYISSSTALALLVDADLTKYQYETLKAVLQKEGYNILPPYMYVLDEKKKCYPENVVCSETKASVNLQSLLDHTTHRLFESFSKEKMKDINLECTLTSKWGCDGSSGHREYNQSLPSDCSDKNILMASMVPLSLSTSNESYWQNNTPSSTRLCRPISFEFTKETKEKVLDLVNTMSANIDKLNNTTVLSHGKQVTVKHNLVFTMLDGKTAQTVTNTSSGAVCYICKAKPTDMNNLEKISQREINNESCKLGISSLHARIKFMECILHLAYNMPFKKWAVKDEKMKMIKQENKKRIQKEFKEKMNLRVDEVQQGTGTSNDGNTSRRFFSNPSLVAEITSVDEDLIDRFRIILQIITCGQKINSKMFKDFSWETAKLYVSKYSWYYMPCTVHKVLIHGNVIIEAAVLPLGMLSEEAEEARNKDYRKFRLMFSRKCSRVATNTDVIQRLLVSSDPFITSQRREPRKQVLELDNIVKEMILSE